MDPISRNALEIEYLLHAIENWMANKALVLVRRSTA